MAHSIVVEQKPLMSILASMQPICTKRTTMPSTQLIQFQLGNKELVLKCTDLEISLQASYILPQGSAHEPRTFLVSGKRIFDIFKEIEGDITFDLHETQLHVQAGTAHFSLNIQDPQEFPPFPERIENMMQINVTHIVEMLSRVAYLIPQNNANPSLNGLYFEIDSSQLTLTATDGHCLAQVKSKQCTLDEPRTWLVPRRAIFEVKKLLESAKEETLFLGTCGNQLVFSGDSFNFFTKLLTHTFPEYSAVLDKEGFSAACIDKSSFVKTLRRSVCLLTGQFVATKFSFDKDAVTISMRNQDVGSLDERIAMNGFDGSKMDIRFYSPYLLSGLPSFSEGELQFFLKNSSRPIIFEANSDTINVTYLVMPVSPASQAQT